MMYKAVAASADPTAPLDIFACDLENDIAKHPEVLGSAVPIAEVPGTPNQHSNDHEIMLISISPLGHELVNATYRSIFSSLHDTGPRTSLPILPSSHVTPDSGTGLVHCAPAHGAEDYAVMRSLGLLPYSSTLGSLLCHVDLFGQFTEDVADEVGERAAHALIGKDVLGDGSKAIVELLMKAGALRKVHRYTHRYPYDWRTDKPVIVM